MGELTTLVYARLDHEDDQDGTDHQDQSRQQSQQQGQRGAPGRWRMQWACAGHPPPLLLLPDGAVEVLRRHPEELLLGVDTTAARTDHTVLLPAGSTVILYTDGLVERRGEHLSTGIEGLARTVRSLAQVPLPELLHETVGLMVGTTAEDDTAVLGVRLHPQP